MAGSSFETEFLQTHNTYRKQHGAPPLAINRNLCRSAQAWAEHLLSIKTLKHSQKDYGENLYYAWSSGTTKLTGREAVESWYKEIKDYNFGRPGFSSETGHFTQVVWKDTKELGIGLATDGNTTFVVGQYLPAGNISNAGYFQRNVLPAGSPIDPKSTGTADKVGQAHSDRMPSHPRNTATSPLGGRREPCENSSSMVADRNFETEFLQTHNTYRKTHGAPPLAINRNLCRSAQAWAEHLLSIKTLKHSQKDYGENLYYAWSSGTTKLTGREAVESWYKEIKDYNFGRPGFSSETGHFTQVVWKDTKELGIGLATDGNTTFVVGQYLPAGNISNAGYFQRNVLPAGSPIDPKSTGTADKVGQAHGASNMHSDRMPSHPRNTATSPLGGRREPCENNSSMVPDRSFETEFLQTHNTYRKTHGAPPLAINKNLCGSAQKWAEHLLSIKTLMHSSGEHGENVYYAWSSASKKLTGREAVESWYSEIKDYSFSRPGFSSKTGHFTQVVWKDTKELGVGLATDGNTTFVVGQYLPAGNISNAGYFERNVLPAGSPVDLKSTPSADRVGQGLAALSIKSNLLPSASHASVSPTHDSHPSPQSKSQKGHDLSQFRQSLLDAQNNYRRQHGARPFSLCPNLCKEAQDWAAHLISINTLKNSGKGHGETMSYKWTSNMVPPTGKEIAESWYKENTKYNFANPGFQNGTGNFTQMIWRSTEQVGIGLGSDGKGKFITVAFYKPPGNITNPGYFQDNVKPAGK